MDVALKRHPLLVTALAPLIPHLVGSAFNIWYNMTVIDPLLIAAGLKQRFIATVIAWNVAAYPVAVWIWTRLLLSLRASYRQLARGENPPASKLDTDRRRLVHLPWFGAAISGGAWFIGAMVFLVSLAIAGRPMSTQLFWHLPISFGVSEVRVNRTSPLFTSKFLSSSLVRDTLPSTFEHSMREFRNTSM